jgi:fructose-bisphosphate aldolase class I
MIVTQLESTARALVPSGRGILAADESHPTIGKRFSALGIENTVESRRVYRQMMFTTPGVAEFISGVILFDETIRQQADDGTPVGDLLAKRGMIPGIKVDKGTKALAGAVGELITEGLDGLRERLAEYRGLGARFAKWRAVITIGSGIPTSYCIDTNAHALARYAALCQEAGLVPIVEPEVLMDGDHTIERCVEVTEVTLHTVFDALHAQRVSLEGMLLKPNMILSGYECPDQADDDTVAEQTIKCLENEVPAAVPGVVFLSGGQSDEDATRRLNVMNARGPHPWELSFSYGRALQSPALQAWGGDPSKVEEAQKAFYRRAKFNSAARSGSYAPEWETAEVA